MNTTEIIDALKECADYGQLEQIRAALDAKSADLKTKFMAQAEVMGIACHDNGAPIKGRRKPKHDPS